MIILYQKLDIQLWLWLLIINICKLNKNHRLADNYFYTFFVCIVLSNYRLTKVRTLSPSHSLQITACSMSPLTYVNCCVASLRIAKIRSSLKRSFCNFSITSLPIMVKYVSVHLPYPSPYPYPFSLSLSLFPSSTGMYIYLYLSFYLSLKLCLLKFFITFRKFL